MGSYLMGELLRQDQLRQEAVHHRGKEPVGSYRDGCIEAATPT